MAQEGYDYCESRAKTPFVPEYLSGLNWRDAVETGLVGKKVEVSKGSDIWSGPFALNRISDIDDEIFKFYAGGEWWVYIRTVEETFQHPTITIGDKELPRPEVEAPEKTTRYFFLRENTEILTGVWWGHYADYKRLTGHRLHLKESRAQEWADWWQETVIKEINK